jgi:hypothetical protein
MGRINVTSLIFEGASAPNIYLFYYSLYVNGSSFTPAETWINYSCVLLQIWSGFFHCRLLNLHIHCQGIEIDMQTRLSSRVSILAEGAIALSVTLSGGALFAS